MAQYTVEDIEILRQKSGISYEEAVNLLEYHNGSLARSLVDLEKNGRLRDAKAGAQRTEWHGRRRRHRALDSLFRLRVKVFKGDVPIVNLSVLFVVFAVLVASWVVIVSALVALVMGYRFAIERDARDFADGTLEDRVKNAGSNVKNTVFNIVRDLGLQNEGKAPEDGAPTEAPEPEKRTESPASGTTPVNVQFSEDGSVRVTEEPDGYHEADIQ